MNNSDAKGILKVISEYSKALNLLDDYDLLYQNDKQLIDNNTLTALTLLIAESNPKEKDIIIDLVMNFLTE